ncbi:MAG TPA: hypothetical protein VG457_14355, partial [Planctomycetota bacterium]|nr:hypothetical protein [Planctomycetota bacterium]
MSLEVPRYDEAQVRAAPLPGPPSLQQAPLDAFGGGAAAAGVTKATQDLAETGGKIQQAKKQSDDQVAVLDAITQLQNKSHDLMYNPNTGLVMVKGKAALPASDQVMTDFNKTASDLMEGLSSPEQRLSFQHHVSSIGSTLNRDALIHADGQLDQYQNDVVKSSLAAKQDDAELHYGDRDQIEMSKEQQVAIIADQARRMGKPPEWADQQAADAVSATNTRVINRMLANQQDQTAKAFYNDVKGAQDSGVEKYGFTGADAAQVEKALEIGTTRGQSARSVNDILSQKGIVDPVTGLIDSAAAMAKVKEIPDQKVQDAARERMQEEIRQAKQNLTDKQEQNFMQAAQVVRDPSAAGRRITDVVPPAILSQVSPEQYNALERMTKDIPNDDKKWIQFETIPPQQLAKMSPAEFTQWQSNFSTENRKTALTQYRDAIDWVAKNGQTDFNQTLSFKERVDETL